MSSVRERYRATDYLRLPFSGGYYSEASKGRWITIVAAVAVA